MKNNVLDLEKKTVLAMIAIYCHGKGHPRPKRGTCESCERLARYAVERTERCVFGEKKPACRLCAVHCYSPDMRQEIAKVMRYAGPKMFWRHPGLTVRHLLAEKKKRKG